MAQCLCGATATAYHWPMATHKRPPLASSHEAEWAEFNREKDDSERELVARMSVAERLEFGQRLSQQRTELIDEYRARHGL
jgi:hypothetical protein